MEKDISKLVLKKRSDGQYICNLTKIMDDNLKSRKTIFSTYIFEIKCDNLWLIRFPGATRGYIKVDENEIIEDIKIYKDSCIYIDIEGLEQKLKDKFLGMKIITLDYKME